MDLTDPRRGDRLVRVDHLDLEARLVLVQVLADQARLAVVRPDEGIAASWSGEWLASDASSKPREASSSELQISFAAMRRAIM